MPCARREVLWCQNHRTITSVELDWDCNGDVHWHTPTRQDDKNKESRRPFRHDVHPDFDHVFLLSGAGNRHQRDSVYFILHHSHPHQLTTNYPDFEVQKSHRI